MIDWIAIKKTRAKLKRPGRKATKPAKRAKPKSRLLTPAEARRRAERHVLRRMFKAASVRDGAAVRLGIYNRGNWASEDAWVVYPNDWTPGTELHSSQIIVICKRTGRVLYEGSAQDEG